MSMERLTHSQRRIFFEIAERRYEPNGRNVAPVNALLFYRLVELYWSCGQTHKGMLLCRLRLTKAGELAYRFAKEQPE